MDDQEILNLIRDLVDEEHHLLKLEEEGKLVGDQHERIRLLEVNLDQCGTCYANAVRTVRLVATLMRHNYAILILLNTINSKTQTSHTKGRLALCMTCLHSSTS